MAEITSAYEAYEAIKGLSWDDLHDATDLMNQAIDERLADSKVRELIFSEEVTEGLTVSWLTEVPAGDENGVPRIAEFAEAPVIDPSKGADNFAKLDANAVSARVSYEQTKLRAGVHVQREINHLTRTIQMNDSRTAMAALNKGVLATDPRLKVETYELDTPWINPDIDPLDDLLRANELIQSAEMNGIQFGYKGDTLWLNPVTASRLKHHKAIRSLYIGNMADSNPLFNGALGNIAGQFNVIEDQALPMGEGWLFQGGDVSGSTIGTEFVWDQGRGETTPFYADGGETSRGGMTRSFRSDYSKWNAHGLRAPKAIVKLTNLV